MNERQPNLISEEQKKIQKDMEIVMATEGFSLLTEKQQQIIKTSLYLQSRAERGNTDFGYSPSYRNSIDYIINKNCHAAILSLEKEQSLKLLSPEEIKYYFFDKNFFEANYVQIENEEELKNQAEKFGFPCVVHIKFAKDHSPDLQMGGHSFLILGHDKNKNIVIWEKMSYGLGNPYRIVTLNDLQRPYAGYLWGFRKLKNLKEKSFEDTKDNKLNQSL